MSCVAFTNKGGQCKRRSTVGCWCKQHGGALSDALWSKYMQPLQQRLASDRGYRGPHPVTTLPADFLFGGDHVYLEWTIISYINGGIRSYEDIKTRLQPAIVDFNKLIQKRVLSQGVSGQPWTNESNILNYCGLIGCTIKGRQRGGLEELLRKYEKHLQRDVSEEGRMEPFYDGETVRIYAPTTVQQSVYYGRGTTWCTAATKAANAFEEYFELGPMYIIIPKNPTHKGEKYQLHIHQTEDGPGDFMDETDTPVYKEQVLALYPELGGLPIAEHMQSRIWLKADDIEVFSDASLAGELGLSEDDYIFVRYGGTIYYCPNYAPTDLVLSGGSEITEALQTNILESLSQSIHKWVGSKRTLLSIVMSLLRIDMLPPNLSTSIQTDLAVALIATYSHENMERFLRMYPHARVTTDDTIYITPQVVLHEFDHYTAALEQLVSQKEDFFRLLMLPANGSLEWLASCVDKYGDLARVGLRTLLPMMLIKLPGEQAFVDILAFAKKYGVKFNRTDLMRPFSQALSGAEGGNWLKLYLLLRHVPESIPEVSPAQVMEIVKNVDRHSIPQEVKRDFLSLLRKKQQKQ